MKLNREILRLAVPSIFANITVPLVGMVDIAVVGHLGATGDISGAAFIGGISIGTMIFDLLYWNFAFLRAGTGGLTAQAYGRLLASGVPVQPADPAFAQCADSALFAHEDTSDTGRCANQALFAYGELGRILLRALRIALLSGLALIALQWVAVKLAFMVVQCSPEVQSLATQYFYIRIWAAPATLSLFAFKGWFIGLQDSVRPMTADLVVNLLNIVLSAALAFGGAGLPHLGFSGVAVGTVIAQWSGFLYCLLATRRRHRHYFISHSLSATSQNMSALPEQTSFSKSLSTSHLPDHVCANRADMNKEVIDNEDVKFMVQGTDLEAEVLESQSFFTMNRDLVLRSAGMIAVYIGFTVISARFGDKMLSVSAIIMKLLMLFSYFTDGFAYAGEALTGRFIGEGSADSIKSTVRGTFAWGTGVAALFMLVYGLGGVPVLQLMTSDRSVVEAGREFLPWLLLMPMIGCPAFVWDGVFIGATATKDLRNSTLLSAIGFFGAWFAGIAIAGARLTPELAIHILMAAYFVHLAVRTVYQTIRWKPLFPKILPANDRQHEGK